jgi:hypothetical protein
MGTPAFDDSRALISGAAYGPARNPAMISVTRSTLGKHPEGRNGGRHAPILHNGVY